jgi:hypothetical protein
MRQLSREPTSFHCILFRRSADDVTVGEEGQRRENRWHGADFCCFLKAKACLGHLEHLFSGAKKMLELLLFLASRIELRE